MKKLIGKILKKKEAAPLGRMTSDTMAEHREQVLSGARRFKYPLQYSRHKLVINTILIILAVILLTVLFGWWRLYVAQDTSEFFYRVTRVIPVPVAKVDGKNVAYSDYLMSFRSSVYYSEKKEKLSVKTDDGKKKIEYYKKQSLQGAIANAYAAKLAKNLSISLTEQELDDYIKAQRQTSSGEISQKTFDASTLEFLGLSPSEYRHQISAVLLRNKVAYAVDDKSLQVAKDTISLINSGAGSDLNSLARTISNQFGVSAMYGASSGFVSKQNQDGGLATEAAKLSKGQITAVPVKSSHGDGYFIIRLIDINDTQVNYEYINIPLTTFTSDLNNIINSDKLKQYIKI